MLTQTGSGCGAVPPAGISPRWRGGGAARKPAQNPTAPPARGPGTVKAVVGFYGDYDLLAQWHHDQIARPRDQIAEKFLGASPMQNRKLYFESSPISYATIDRNKTSFMLVNGTADDIVDPAQTQQFWQALNQAGTYSRRLVI